MRDNPRDWRIEDIKAVADGFGIEYRSSGGSHVVFRSAHGAHVTIPAKRPIKPIYIKMFLSLIDSLETGEANETDSEKQI